MIEPVKHDWPKIITEICEVIKPDRINGNGVGKLASLMKRQVGQIKRWQAGTEPKHYEGQMILVIHADVVPRGTLQNEPLTLQNHEQSI